MTIRHSRFATVCVLIVTLWTTNFPALAEEKSVPANETDTRTVLSCLVDPILRYEHSRISKHTPYLFSFKQPTTPAELMDVSYFREAETDYKAPIHPICQNVTRYVFIERTKRWSQSNPLPTEEKSEYIYKAECRTSTPTRFGAKIAVRTLCDYVQIYPPLQRRDDACHDGHRFRRGINFLFGGPEVHLFKLKGQHWQYIGSKSDGEESGWPNTCHKLTK